MLMRSFMNILYNFICHIHFTILKIEKLIICLLGGRKKLQKILISLEKFGTTLC